MATLSACSRRLGTRGAAYISQNTTKRTSEGGSTEEQRDSELSLPSLVPHGEIVDDTRKESGLSDTEEEAGHKEACEVLDHSHQSSNNAPQNGQRGQPEPRRSSLEDDVAGNL